MMEATDVLTPAHDSAEHTEKAHFYIKNQDIIKNIASARLAHALVDEILAGIAPGMLESEVKAATLSCFNRHGIERTWHQPYIRFGSNTLLTFKEKPQEDRTLGADDIAYIDIGIVLEGIEGDAGRTVVFGRNPLFHSLRKASENIFHTARQFWKQNNPTGVALYEYIHVLAKKEGFEFCLDPAGHLIGEFPHIGWKKGINHFPEAIAAGTWILEIQIRHPELPFASFYENLLY